MYCRYCGQKVSDDGAFCSFCGKALNNMPKAEPIKAQAFIVEPTPIAEQRNDLESSGQAMQEAQPKSRKAFQKVATILTRVAIPFNAVAFGFFVFSIFLAVVCFIETGDSYLEAVSMANMCFSLATSLIAIGAEASIVAFVFSRIQKEDEDIKRRALGVFIGGIVLLVLISVAYGMFIGFFGGEATIEFLLF
ncbi:MAG: zinc ribbon domain-containing protein [Clostridia bacterium]|nr:zinc ribbon domain-containing protein [Clostridia bacterium]